MWERNVVAMRFIADRGEIMVKICSRYEHDELSSSLSLLLMRLSNVSASATRIYG